jgi:hypothetical protein
MRVTAHRLGWLAVLLAVASPASGQLAQSPDFQATALTLDAVGGGTSSLSLAGHTSCGDVSGGPMSSPQFNAVIGFLGGDEPDVTDVPVLFGMQPGFGPIAGGTELVLGGINFDKFGSAASISVTIDGTPVEDLVVQSNSLITATAPAGLSGPHDVVISSSLGATTEGNAFVYTPAVVTTPRSPLKSQLEIRNYGAVGDSYFTLISLTSWVAPTRFGTLLIGPTFLELLPPTPYPAPLGIARVTLHMPNAPVLHGLVIHFQSLSMSQQSPLEGALTNASTTSIP